MPAQLALCPSCTRHVKVGSSSCPFCGGNVPADVPERAARPLVGPLTRAAILFGGVAASACGSAGASQVLPPYGVFVWPLPYGDEVGDPCNGDVYVEANTEASTGYLVCVDGAWEYTTSNPADDGFTLDTGDAGAAGSDAAGSDSGMNEAGGADATNDVGTRDGDQG
jgi:hypothetical protein